MADLHTSIVHHDIVCDVPIQVGKLVRRLTANNASPFTGPGTNTYILGNEEAVKGTDKFVVIDPGPNDAAHIEAIIAATDGRISDIIATHAHNDHSPAALPLKKKTGARLIGLPTLTESQYIDSTFVSDVVLTDGMQLDFDGFSLKAIYTPGHLKQHMCFFLEQERLLFTGDHIMQGATVTIIPPHGGSMTDYLRSLMKLKGRGIEFLAPAHGHILSEAEAVIDELHAHRLVREAVIFDVLKEKIKGTVEQLSPAVYPELKGEITLGAKAMLWAHLQKLLDDGKLTRYREKHWPVGEDIWQLINS